MIRSEAYDKLREERGRLADGVSWVLLNQIDALRAVGMLKEAGIPILGGDLWVETNGDLRPRGQDNWCTDPVSGEANAAYFARTWKESEDYIRRYPIKAGERVYFAIVDCDPAAIAESGRPHA